MTKLLEISIGVSGERAVSRKLGLAADIIGDMTETWTETVHPLMLAFMRRQFATEGAHGGKPWAKYGAEPNYAAFKRAMVGHEDVLRWQKGGPYEQLYPSLTEADHDHHIFVTYPRGFRFGTSVRHARRLTKGGVGPFDERYPGRAIIAMRPAQKKQLITEIQRDIVRRLGADAIRRARFV